MDYFYIMKNIMGSGMFPKQGLHLGNCYNYIDVHPVSGSIGAEIRGVDLRCASDPVWKEIKAAYLEFLALFFPDQILRPTEMASVGRHFGCLGYYPFIEGLKEEPYIVAIIKEMSERKNFGEGWHSDTTYMERPPAATMLYSLEVPKLGGDTLFANMHMAYETLSDAMKDMLSPLRAVNSARTRKGGGRAEGNHYHSVKLINRNQNLIGVHPVARTHPKTGRKALYVNALHTTNIEGWSREESKPVLDYLYRHKELPEFTYRHTWSTNTLAIWDNCAVQHFALNDYHGQRREMHRLSIAGDVPV